MLLNNTNNSTKYKAHTLPPTLLTLLSQPRNRRIPVQKQDRRHRLDPTVEIQKLFELQDEDCRDSSQLGNHR